MTKILPDGRVGVYEVKPEIEPVMTIPRSPRYDERDPIEAALAVGEFIGAPQGDGRYEISRFDITEEQMIRDYMRSHGDGKGRWGGGHGRFIKLERVERGAGEEGGDAYEVVMSNTPQEMEDHEEALTDAYGDVLVHGLGLSCVVSGMLAMPEVEHIDVVEIEPWIIEAVGPAYDDEPRVTIHQGDAMTFEWPTEKRWDYVWHDIWTMISEDNIDLPDKAEFGITYEMVEDQFADRTDLQGFWGRDQAVEQRERRATAKRKRDEIKERWERSTPDERLNIIIDFHYDEAYDVPGIAPKPDRETWIKLFEANGMMDKFREVAQKDECPVFFFDW